MGNAGPIFPGVKAKLGIIAPGAEFTNGFKVSNDLVPALELNVDAVTAMRNLESIPSNVEKTLRKFFGW